MHGSYLFYEFKHTSFIKITRVPFTQLSIYITNAVNNQLKLQPSYPTFLVLEVTDEIMSQQFQVTCYSHLPSPTAEELFPDNTLSNFKVSLPNELDLSSKWEMAMASISFPSRLHDGHMYMSIGGQVITFSPRSSTSVEGFMKHIELRFNGFYNRHELRLTVSETAQGRLNGFNFQRGEKLTQRLTGDKKEDKKDKEKRMRHHPYSSMDEELKIRISKGIMHMLGHTKRQEDYGFKLKHKRRKFVPRMPEVVDFLTKCRPTPMSMLYCDIVRPSIIADIKGSLLQLIPVEDFMVKEVSTHYVPRHLIFHPLVPYKIKNIHFSMRQTDGTPNDFISDVDKNSQDSVIVTLLFRLRKK